MPNPNALFDRLTRFGNRTLMMLTPKSRQGDYFISLCKFVNQHHRLPSNRMLLNDVVFRIKTSSQLCEELYRTTTDKETAKEYIRAKVGSEHVVPTLAVLHSRQEVLDYEFPDRCMIKPTHLAGRYFLKTQDQSVDKEEVASWLSMNLYEKTRERHYRFLEPKIIVEPILFEDSKPVDYKTFCYKGEPRAVLVIENDIDKTDNTRKMSVYSMDWQLIDPYFKQDFPSGPVPKPANLQEMIDVARTLAKDFEFVRVDMYSDGKEVYVGELTHTHDNVSTQFHSPDGEKTLSAHLFA